MAQWHRVAAAEEIREGAALGVAVGEVKIGLFRVGERCHAVSDICTHAFALLSEGWQEGAVIECPLHQATFDLTTGKCLGPPAEEDLKVFDVKVENGDVYVLVPDL